MRGSSVALGNRADWVVSVKAARGLHGSKVVVKVSLDARGESTMRPAWRKK